MSSFLYLFVTFWHKRDLLIWALSCIAQGSCPPGTSLISSTQVPNPLSWSTRPWGRWEEGEWGVSGTEFYRWFHFLTNTFCLYSLNFHPINYPPFVNWMISIIESNAMLQTSWRSVPTNTYVYSYNILKRSLVYKSVFIYISYVIIEFIHL